MKYQVIIGNIGTVLDTNNGFDAIREYGRGIDCSKSSTGRMANEPVTLMRNNEPWREYDPNAGFNFYAEVTDTFGGDANYSWVNRYLIKAKTYRGAVSKLTRETGYDLRMVMDMGDQRRYNVTRACICAFVQWADDQDRDYPSIQRI